MTGNPITAEPRSRTPGSVFFTIGVIFLAVGSSGQSTFIAVGAAFMAVGVALLVRPPRVRGPKP
jgi:hypothetical protein